MLTADPADDGFAREALDAAVLAALGGHGWTVLLRENLPDGGRHYQLHSLTDEPGTLTIAPIAEQPASGNWRSLDPEALDITVSVGLLPREPMNLRRAETLGRSVRERLAALRRDGHAPIPGR